MRSIIGFLSALYEQNAPLKTGFFLCRTLSAVLLYTSDL